MDRKRIACELVKIARQLTRRAAGPILYVEDWDGDKPVIQVHNRHFTVDKGLGSPYGCGR